MVVTMSVQPTLIPIHFRCLAAVPGTSLNDRQYSREVLEASVPFWPGKPFLLDHELHDVEGRAIGILSAAKYDKDRTRDGEMVEGLWLEGFGRVTPKLYEKIQGSAKVPPIITAVSIGGQGDARPGIDKETGRTVSRIIKLTPQELSCISIPGIPQAHIAQVELIQEAYRMSNVKEEVIPFPDLTKGAKEALDKKIDTAGDSITIQHDPKEQPMLNTPPAKQDKDDEEPEKKVINQPGVMPLQSVDTGPGIKPTKEIFYKSPIFKDIVSGRVLHRPKAFEGKIEHPSVIPDQPPGVRVYRDVPRPEPPAIEELPIRKYNYLTRTGHIEKAPLHEVQPMGRPSIGGPRAGLDKPTREQTSVFAPLTSPYYGTLGGTALSQVKTLRANPTPGAPGVRPGGIGALTQSAEVRGTKEKPPADTDSDTGATAGVGRPAKGDSRGGSVFKFSSEDIVQLSKEKPKQEQTLGPMMRPYTGTMPTGGYGSLARMPYTPGGSSAIGGQGPIGGYRGFTTMPKGGFGVVQSADDSKNKKEGDTMSLLFRESIEEEYLTREEEEELDLLFSIPDSELDMAEAWVISLFYPETYTPPNMMVYTEAKKWIQRAIRHPGALRKQLGITGDEPIPLSRLHAAAKKGGTLGRRARLAITLRGMRKRKK